MNIHLPSQPYENMNATSVFCKYSSHVQIIFNVSGGGRFDLCVLSRPENCDFYSWSQSLTAAVSAAVTGEITDTALNFVFILFYLNTVKSAWRNMKGDYSLCHWRDISLFFLGYTIQFHSIRSVGCSHIALPVNLSVV